MKRNHRSSVITILMMLLSATFKVEAQLPNTDCDIVSEGQVACLLFCGTADDGSGNKNHGTVNGATLTTDRFGTSNCAYDFDGDDFIQFDSPVHAESPLSVSFWFKYSGLPSDSSYLIANGAESRNSQGFYFFIDTKGALRFGVGQESLNFKMSALTLNPITLNQWHHVTGTWDGSTDAEHLKLYLDGQLAEVNRSLSNLFFGKPRNLVIGLPSNKSNYPTIGQIDDVMIYQRVLSESEIKQLAGIESVSDPSCDAVKDGLVACYPFSGDAKNHSGNAPNGIINGATLTTDRLDQAESAIEFDGINDWVNVPDHESLNFGPNQDYSLSAWFKAKPNQANYQGTILSKLNPTTATVGKRAKGYALVVLGEDYLENEGKVCVRIGDGIGGSHGSEKLCSNQAYDDNTWHNVAVTLDRDELAKLYIDGELSNSTDVSHLASLDMSYPEGLEIGREGVFDTYFFNGSLDDILIYNRVLTDSEIQTLYNPEPSDENRLTITKTGDGRGTFQARIKGEDSNFVCKSACTEASEIYPLDSQVILSAWPENGFVFSGWGGDCTGSEKRLLLTMDAAQNCTARFEPDNSNTALLTVNTDGTGEGTVISTSSYINCGETCSAYHRLDRQVVLEATPDADNLFIGWSGDCMGIKPRIVVTMDAAKACTATFKPKPTGALTLSVDKLGDGQGIISGRVNGKDRTLYCDTSCQQTGYDYEAGNQVILMARVKEGFMFKQWGGDCSGIEPRIIVLMDQAKHCTAQFYRDPNLVWYDLTVNIGGTGKGSVTAAGLNCTEISCTMPYQPDEVVRLVATPTLFSEFIAWSGNCEGTKTAKLTMTEDLACIAEFKSEFELFAEQMGALFYANATLENDGQVTSYYPQTAENEERLKEAFWLSIATLMQTDQHLGLSDSQTWPHQLNGIEQLPADASAKYTLSVQIQSNGFVGIKVELINQLGQIETVPVIIYYGGERPVLADDSGWYSANGMYLSRDIIPTLWW